jgi:hypothetical protein
MKVTPTITHEASAPHLVVVDGAVHGFPESGGVWPASFRQARGVLVTMPFPLCEGAFWNETLAPFGERLVLLLSIEDLRRYADLHLSPMLSWERTRSEIVYALRRLPALAPLAGCGHLIVSFDRHNALWYRPARGAEPERSLLHYEPGTLESGLGNSRENSLASLTAALTTYLSHALQGDMQAPNRKQPTALSAWSGLAEAIAMSLARAPGSQACGVGLSSTHGGSGSASGGGR